MKTEVKTAHSVFLFVSDLSISSKFTRFLKASIVFPLKKLFCFLHLCFLNTFFAATLCFVFCIILFVSQGDCSNR